MPPATPLAYPKTPANKVKRYNVRASYDTATIHSIVNSTPIVHVSFINAMDGNPAILPMIGRLGSFSHPSSSLEEPQELYVHGYVSSRIMNLARRAPGEGSEEGAEGSGGGAGGMRVAVCVTKLDGLILSLTPFSHDLNYRSAVIHGVAEVVTDPEEKLWAMELITNGIVPGRWSQSRVPPDEGELQSTSILRITIESASAKIRSGEPHDEAKDMKRDDMLDSVWTGVIPIYETMGDPVPGPYNKVKLPEYVETFVKERSEVERKYATSAAVEPESAEK